MDKPIKIYAKDADPAALEQFYSAMNEEYAIKGALMADAHKGYSLPIGGVVATKGAVYPAWVGYDIGCGMCAVPTNIFREEIEQYREDIFTEIKNDIPLGKNHHNDESHLTDEEKHRVKYLKQFTSDDFDRLWEKYGGYRQLGTLGSGNHFIEIGYCANSCQIWIIIHSGSRGIGWQTARNYMCIAASSDKPEEGNHFLEEDSIDFEYYWNDLNFCTQFALMNRKNMIMHIEKIFQKIFPNRTCFEMDRLINRNHNHVQEKEGMFIHRKGATHAEAGMYGVIPGNMHDGSFIVVGKGNPDSLWSSSHGAGRVLGRNQAKKTLSLDEFKEQMSGITATANSKTLEEAPGAYKNIFEVMKQQEDLVDILVHVKPLINVKGQ